MVKTILDEIKRIKAIADTGLLYASNGYEKERYHELQEITYRLLSQLSDYPVESLKVSFPPSNDYPTVKVDVRAMLLSKDGKVLLVKESADGQWSLPGGWADVGYSPKEVAVKEVKEETGLDCVPRNLLAVFDKRMHHHPPQPHYVYKLVIWCEATSWEFCKGFDVLDVQFFAVDDLPELSQDRILKSQIELLYRKVVKQEFETYFD
jgi:ADP-ribose pyrophosphatase YjhB (NUDIX family)